MGTLFSFGSDCTVRHFRGVSLVLILVLAFSPVFSSCSHKTKTWVAPDLPQTAGVAEQKNRIVMLPVKFEALNFIGNRETVEKQMRGRITTTVCYQLEKKGYEVVPIDIYRDMYMEKLGLSRLDVEEYIHVLTSWAGSSPDGADPPKTVEEAVTSLCRPFGAHGIFVVQGFTDSCDKLFYLSILTLSLTSPLWWACWDAEMRAELYDAGSGRIVWRSRRYGMGGNEPFGIPKILDLEGFPEGLGP